MTTFQYILISYVIVLALVVHQGIAYDIAKKKELKGQKRD
jgi:hypothetical protein